MQTPMLTDLAARTDAVRTAVLAALGEEAVAMVRAQMASGYDRPIRRTGALMANVSAQSTGSGITVGNTLPYAGTVHNGTARSPGRPYLTDALTGGGENLRQAVVRALRSCL